MFGRRGAVRTALQGMVLVAAGLLAVNPAVAQDDLRKEVEELKKGQEQILKQLQEIKTLVQTQAQARPAAPAAPSVKDVVFNLGSNPTQGSEKASLVLVEFTDYQ